MTKDNHSDRHPAFGPEHKLYFSRSFGPFTKTLCRLSDNGEAIELTDRVENVLDTCPSVSPDGEKIVYVREEVKNDDQRYLYISGLWIADKEGNNQTKITIDDVANYFYNPEWSPNGDLIASEAKILGSKEIATIKPNGTEFANMTKYSAPVPEGVCAKPLSGDTPSWAGRFVIFAEALPSSTGKSDILIVNPMGNDLWVVTSDFYTNKCPVWVQLKRD